VLRAVDDFLIDRILQPAVDVASFWKVLTRYNLARICTVLQVVLTYFELRANGIGDPAYSSVISGMPMFVAILVGIVFYFEGVDGKAARTVMPRARYSLYFIRALLLASTPLALDTQPFPFDIFNFLMNAATTLFQMVAFWIIACRPGIPPVFLQRNVRLSVLTRAALPSPT
jgi:hypothetical protein